MGNVKLPRAARRIRHNLDASEDVHKQLVQQKASLDLSGDAHSHDVGEENENRGFLR